MVPAEDLDPDVLQINIMELETNDGPFANGVAYANKYLLFAVDPADYLGKSILAVPRCCQKRKGTQDRERVNSSVAERDARTKGVDGSRECSVGARPEPHGVDSSVSYPMVLFPPCQAGDS